MLTLAAAYLYSPLAFLLTSACLAVLVCVVVIGLRHAAREREFMDDE